MALLLIVHLIVVVLEVFAFVIDLHLSLVLKEDVYSILAHVKSAHVKSTQVLLV